MTPEQIRNLMHIAAALGDLRHYERLEMMLIGLNVLYEVPKSEQNLKPSTLFII